MYGSSSHNCGVDNIPYLFLTANVEVMSELLFQPKIRSAGSHDGCKDRGKRERDRTHQDQDDMEGPAIAPDDFDGYGLCAAC